MEMGMSPSLSTHVDGCLVRESSIFRGERVKQILSVRSRSASDDGCYSTD